MAPTDQLQEVKIMLHGTAASEGIGIGKVMLIEEHSLEYTPRTVTDTEAESQRFKAAVLFATILKNRQKIFAVQPVKKRQKFLQVTFRLSKIRISAVKLKS